MGRAKALTVFGKLVLDKLMACPELWLWQTCDLLGAQVLGKLKELCDAGAERAVGTAELNDLTEQTGHCCGFLKSATGRILQDVEQGDHDGPNALRADAVDDGVHLLSLDGVPAPPWRS